jgi:UDP-glucuronate decarboxylase
MDYKRQHGVNVKIARIFNTYGPNMDPRDGRVVSNFIMQALGSRAITIYGDGSQTRSFCYVSDLVDGLIKLMESGDDVVVANLGNPGEFTIMELAEKVIVLTESDSPIIREPLPIDDPRQRKPDITIARTKLGWTPKVDLDQGLTHTIEYFKRML